MKITIHRGANQIGGCITEIATNTTRILIDFGLNLPNNEGKIEDNLATTAQVEKLTHAVDAIIYTHYHGDHVGLFNLVPKRVKQYIGCTALEVMKAKQTYINKSNDAEILELFSTYKSGKAFVINNDMRITPFFVSHSACDANMLLIEADGKRILHTGDFRDHGYLGKGLKKVIEKYIGQVDFLITEGTMLSRGSEKVATEKELMTLISNIMKQKKYIFVQCSSTDMERLATFHKANPKGRLFVCDTYQADILNIFSLAYKRHSSLFNFDDIATFPKDNLLTEMVSKGFCALIRVNGSKGKYAKFIEKSIREIPTSEQCLIYSMWSGYVAEGKHQKSEYIDFRKRFSSVADIHTSGHASKDCLTEVCSLTNPTSAIIPIHCEQSCEYKNLSISPELKSKIITHSCFVDGVNIDIL